MLLPVLSFTKRLAALLMALLFAGTVLCAQTYPIQSITFAGAPAFTPAELLTASSLSAGASLDQAGMQAAAARLDATGMFATVRFSFNGRELHYELTPALDLLPVRFENFPWWDVKEISAQLTSSVPLFHGQAARDSGTQQKMVEKLTAILSAQQVEAKITATPDVDLATGKSTALVFRVTVPPIQIGAVTFTGTNGEFVSRLEEVGHAATGQEYSTLGTPLTLTQAVQSIYRDKGYLQVEVPSVVHQPPVVEAVAVRVPVAVTVAEGMQYRLGHISLAGSVAMDQVEFLSKAILKPGDVVEQEKLRRSMQILSAPYVTRGYLRAKISAVPDFHPANGSVDYQINVTPGDVYHMGKLEVKDLDPERTALVISNWKLDAGAPYDASYVAQFLKRNAKELHALDGYSAGYKQFEHEDTHVVDLVVTFRKGGPVT